MALGFAGQLQAWGQQPTLAFGVEIKVKPVLEFRLGGEGLGFEDLGLQADQHRCGQKGFAGFGEILLVTSAASLVQRRHQLGHFNPLAELIEKAVDDSDHINVPGV